MKILKKSALSLAVAGVVYGTALTPVYAADVEVNTADAGKVVGTTDPGTDKITDPNITIKNGDTVIVKTAIAALGAEVAMVTVDVNAKDTNTDVLETTVQVDANVVASASSATNAEALLIKTNDGGANEDSLKGNVNINADLTGKGTGSGLKSTVDIAGNVVIGKDATVSGVTAVELKNVDGSVIINGAVTGTTSALVVNGAVSEGITNNGTMSGDISFAGVLPSGATEVSNVFTNNKTITSGDVTAAVGNKVTFNNAGSSASFSGSLDGVGDIDFNNTGDATLATASGALVGKLNITNSGTLKVDAATGADVVKNNSGGTITIEDGVILTAADLVTNSGTINNEAGGTGAVTASKGLTNNSGGVIDLSGSGVGVLTVSGAALTNMGNIKAGTVNVGADSTNSGTLTAATLALGTNKYTNSGTTNISTAITGTGVVTNTGTLKFTAASIIAGGDSLVSKGTLYIGKDVALTSTGVVTNGGVLVAEEGSSIVTGALMSKGAKLNLVIQNTDFDISEDPESDDIKTLFTTTGSTFDSGSTIVIGASDDVLKKVGEKVEDHTLLSAGVLTYEDATLTTDAQINDALKKLVSSGSILLKVDSVVADVSVDTIQANLEVLSAGDLVKGYGLGESTQKLAGKLQTGVSVQTALDNAYGSFASNTTSEAKLKSYLDNVRPDDTNSAAMAGADMAHGVMGNITSRGSAVRTGVNSGDMQANGGFWVQGLYGKSDQEARGGALAYKGDLRGMTFGVDREFGGNTTGIAFSYGKSDVDFDRDQKDTVKSYMASVYNIWEQGNLYVDSSLSIGSSKHESKRLNGSDTAKYGSTQVGAQAMVGYYFNQGDVMIEPMAGARLTSVNVDAINYTSMGNTEATSYRKMEVGFGAALSKAFAVGTNSTITPRAAVMYYHDFVGDELDAQVNFAGETYAIKGASAVKGSWEMDLGVNVMSGENFTVSAGYTHVRKTDFSSNNLNAKLKYMF